jgi:hypothetical protein
MRRVLKTVMLGALVALAGCQTPNTDAVEENAIVVEDDTRAAADSRADNLDRVADDIDSGNATGVLRNEAAQDRAEAEEIRAEGSSQADAIETNVEDRVGVNRN